MAKKRQFTYQSIVDNKGVRDVANSFSKDMNKATQEWAKEVKSVFGQGIRDGFQYGLSSGQGGKAIGAFLKTNITQVYSDFQKALRAGNVEAAQQYNEILDKRVRTFSRELDAMARANKAILARQDQSFTERADVFNQSLNKAGRGGLGGVFDSIRGLGGRAEQFGLARQGKYADKAVQAAQAGDQGAMAKAAQMAKMGETIASVGKAAMGFAAVAAIILTLVKLFMDLEKRIKDMNKAIMEGAGASDFGLTPLQIKSGDLSKKLEEIRKQTTSVNENFMKFRASAAEQQKILSTFNQAGITYAKMDVAIAKGSKHMKDYSDITALALTYSRNLGVESSQIAQGMGTLADVTGQNLEQVAESFSLIQKEALLGGFMTKRFYSAIIEATSGMAFYGVSIVETTALLSKFDSLLGEAKGTEIFKKMAQEGNKSFQDSLQEFLIKDPEFVKEQFKDVYATRFTEMQRIQEQSTTAFKGRGLEDLLRDPNLKQTLAQMEAEGEVSAQIGTNLLNLAQLKEAAAGNMAAMMGARSLAGPGFETALKLRSMKQMGAGESIGDVFETAVRDNNAGLMVALEQIAKEQGKSLQELLTLDRKNTGRFEYLQDIAKTGGEVPKHLADLGYSIEKMPDGTGKIMLSALDAQGQVIENSGVVIADKMDMFTKQPTKDGVGLEKQLTEDQKIAKQISSNITGLTEMMEQTTNMILEDIYDLLMMVYQFLIKDDIDLLKDAAKEIAVKKEKKKIQAQEEQTKEEIGALEKEMVVARSTGDEKRVTELQKQIDEKEGELFKLEKKEMILDKAAAIRSGMTAEERRAGGGGGELEAAGEMGLKIGGIRPEDVKYAVLKAVNEDREAEEDTMGYWGSEQLAREAEKKRGSLSARTMESFKEQGLDKVFGEETLQEILQAAQEEGKKARDKMDWWDPTTEKQGAEREAFATVMETWMGTLFAEQGKSQDEANKSLKKIEENTEKKTEKKSSSAIGMGGSVLDIWLLLGGGAKPAKDLILPAKGGKPIITDERDTLMAFKPGGPISAAMGGATAGGAGAGGGSVNVNIYGGDQKKVYDTVMRVMKVLGHA